MNKFACTSPKPSSQTDHEQDMLRELSFSDEGQPDPWEQTAPDVFDAASDWEAAAEKHYDSIGWGPTLGGPPEKTL